MGVVCLILLDSYLRGVRSERALRGEALAADVAVEGPVLGALHLGVVVAEVLLQVGELDEGAPALGQVALVGPLACNTKTGVSEVSPGQAGERRNRLIVGLP